MRFRALGFASPQYIVFAINPYNEVNALRFRIWAADALGFRIQA